ncbi:MAG TPA: multicopper oxidase domain-containing protein [Vicinamibacterales bacterium]|nr:multicopper oxidase domain-containing protein [Vicinamibacterales bacterium]
MRHLTAGLVVAAALCTACGLSGPARPLPGTGAGELATAGMPALAGQQRTCAGSRQKAFDLTVTETAKIDLGMGFTFGAWTYNGRLPGPTLEVCEGDTVAVRVHNHGDTSHGFDTHAFQIDARRFGPTAPGTTLTVTGVVETPGVYLYHCSAGPVTDFHIKSGLHGAMIVYPRDHPLRPARELVVVEDAVYGTPDAHGLIPGTESTRSQHNDELFSMFNGRLGNEPVRVNPGDLIRIYFVNVGPHVASAHVIGDIFDRVSLGTTWIHDIQTDGVPAGSAAILEFRIPGPGVFPLVDHDKLAFLPFGLSLPFDAGGAPRARQ